MNMKRSAVSWQRALGLLCCSCLFGIPTPVARAATYTVTKTADTNDGTCDADCSLREAVIASNTYLGSDTIIVPAGTYTLAIPGKGEELAATGDLDIRGSTTIQGAGQAVTIIDGAGIDRVFDLQLVSGIAVTLSALTVQNGNPGSDETGGGIRLRHVNSALTMENVRVQWNTATNGRGGGIGAIVGAGIITLTGTTVSGNTAIGGDGGGIYASELHMTSSTVSGNEAEWGGGISAGVASSLAASTVSGNTAAGQGGGIWSGGDISLTSSTISGNTADIGGGIHEDYGTASLTNCTFSENAANSGSALDGSASATITFANTLVAGTCSGWATFATNRGNLESPGDTCGLTDVADRVNVPDPKIGPLADNGGPTLTHALFATSPARDKGIGANCPPEDQRGVTRPQGDGCDIGAYELTWWDGSSDAGGGWRWLSWLGFFNVDSEPWIYHQDLEWLYTDGSTSANLWLFYPKMPAWLWTSSTTFPFLFRSSDGSWLYYLPESTQPCWFHNETTGLWEAYN